MKIEVLKATNLQLDWMVAKAQGYNFVIVSGRGACRFLGVQRTFGNDQYELMPLRLTSTLEQARDADYPGVFYPNTRYWCPSIDWSQGGPIIDREVIHLTGWRTPERDVRVAAICTATREFSCMGPTSLIAAMRCFVVSKLGDEVEMPEKLMS